MHGWSSLLMASLLCCMCCTDRWRVYVRSSVGMWVEGWQGQRMVFKSMLLHAWAMHHGRVARMLGLLRG